MDYRTAELQAIESWKRLGRPLNLTPMVQSFYETSSKEVTDNRGVIVEYGYDPSEYIWEEDGQGSCLTKIIEYTSQ